jgi:hypothetical protein
MISSGMHQSQTRHLRIFAMVKSMIFTKASYLQEATDTTQRNLFNSIVGPTTRNVTFATDAPLIIAARHLLATVVSTGNPEKATYFESLRIAPMMQNVKHPKSSVTTQ